MHISSIVNDGIGKVLYLLKQDPTSTKSESLHICFYVYRKHKALKKTTFFTLDVFMHTKSTKSNFLHPRFFYAYKTRKKQKSFLFAYVQFVLFFMLFFLLDGRFYARLRLFLYSFAYVLFMFFYVK